MPHPHLIDTASGEIVGVDDDGLSRLVEEEARGLGYRLINYQATLFVEGRKSHRQRDSRRS